MFLDFIKEQVEMWVDNFKNDMEFEEYTQEDIDNLNINDIVYEISTDRLWDELDNVIQENISSKLNKGE